MPDMYTYGYLKYCIVRKDSENIFINIRSTYQFK